MPKQAVSSCSRAFFMEPMLASMLSHAHVYSDWFADDPEILIFLKGKKLGPSVRLSEAAELDLRAKAAYDAFRILNDMRKFALHRWSLSSDSVFIGRVLNPTKADRPFTFRYCSPLERASSYFPVDVVRETHIINGVARPTLEVHFE